ncbi:MAG: TIGR03000 domain-containing protein, partial [Planctomycetota bacterium]|nr:TIGR03000 domain-containing protein [Planctomycetota bacterium]
GGSHGSSGGSHGSSGGHHHKPLPASTDVPPPAPTAPATEAAIVPANQAVLVVEVPQDAVLFIQDTRMSQLGSVRRVMSPVIKTGVNYYYNVRVEYSVDGQKVAKSAKATVVAGRVTSLKLDSASELVSVVAR